MLNYLIYRNFSGFHLLLNFSHSPENFPFIVYFVDVIFNIFGVNYRSLWVTHLFFILINYHLFFSRFLSYLVKGALERMYGFVTCVGRQLMGSLYCGDFSVISQENLVEFDWCSLISIWRVSYKMVISILFWC